jgi:hypothetical protein
MGYHTSCSTAQVIQFTSQADTMDGARGGAAGPRGDRDGTTLGEAAG